MANKKDLVEAHQFSRRRLVSAFLSGAPGGREVEPPRPGRTVFGGAVVAVLLVAGGAVAHFLHPAAATGWDKQDGLIITKGGARYVVVGGQSKKDIRPVVNLTSAQLILGLDLEKSSQVIDQDEIAKKRPGTTIGISGGNVPEQLPTKDEFINTGWTACTDDGAGTFVNISDKPDVKAGPTSGFLVKTSQSTYLIAESTSVDGVSQAYSYDLKGKGNYLDTQIFDSPPPVITVPQAWVDLFPAGAPITYDSFGITDAGQQYKGSDAGGSFTIGALANFNANWFVLTDKGWASLTEFAASVYQTTASMAGKTQPTATLTSTPAVNGNAALKQTSWPAEKPQADTGAPCARLNVKSNTTKPYVTLGVQPGKAAWDPTAAPKPDAGPQARVDAGKGAFVFVGTGPDSASGTPFLIDSNARTNKIDDDTTLTKLQLTPRSGPVIAKPWVDLLPEGTTLSTDLALCPPSTSSVKDSQCVQTQ